MAKRIREKAEARKQNKDKRPHASVTYVRMSPSKVERVLNIVRGMAYQDAIATLENMPHESAGVVAKLINSAAANAEHNMGYAKQNLYVAECWVTPGPTLKRLIMKAKGSASRMLKRTSHIFVVLDSQEVK